MPSHALSLFYQTERTNGFCFSYQTDPEEWCNQILPHKFSPAPATMFTSVEFINHADDDSFPWSKTGCSYLKY